MATHAPKPAGVANKKAAELGARAFLVLLKKTRAQADPAEPGPGAGLSERQASARSGTGPAWPTGTPLSPKGKGLKRWSTLLRPSAVASRAAPAGVVSVRWETDPDFCCYGKPPLPPDAARGPFRYIVSTVNPTGPGGRPLTGLAEESAFFKALDNEARLLT